MTTLVHIAASSQEDPRCRLLASAIRQYMQADTQTEADHIQGHIQTGTEPAEPDPRTEEEEEIHPPPPQPSSHPFTTHITPTLAMLAAKLPLQRMYRPLRQSRPLRVWERGYWLYFQEDIHGDLHGGSGAGTGIGTGTGNSHPRDKDLWQFLSQIIQQGKAGWGVWGVRKQSQSAHQIKVYCWGEVVSYIYLLFLVGSDRQIMSLQWRDAADHVVVQM